MRHISIIIPEGDISVSNVEGTLQIFSEVNSFHARAGKLPLFNIQLVGLRRETRTKRSFSIYPDVLIDEVEKTDLIIIPAIQSDMAKAMEDNRAYIPWIVKQYKNGAEIASLCIGSFLLAATGLVNGKKCATHWIAAADFKKMFPEVIVMPDQVITGENGIYSSGGAYSSLNLILYLIEKYAGRDMAILCSKVFQIEIERNSQSEFMIFNAQKEHEDDVIKQAQAYIEKNYPEKITVDELASKLAISRRNLERRFKKVTFNSIVEYIQRVRIEAAKMTLEQSRENVNEAMYKVGYTDTKAFRMTFKKITGLSPVEYRNKYRRMELN